MREITVINGSKNRRLRVFANCHSPFGYWALPEIDRHNNGYWQPARTPYKLNSSNELRIGQISEQPLYAWEWEAREAADFDRTEHPFPNDDLPKTQYEKARKEHAYYNSLSYLQERIDWGDTITVVTSANRTTTLYRFFICYNDQVVEITNHVYHVARKTCGVRWDDKTGFLKNANGGYDILEHLSRHLWGLSRISYMIQDETGRVKHTFAVVRIAGDRIY